MSELSPQSVNRYGINVEGGQNVISGNTFNLSLPPLEPTIDGPPNNLKVYGLPRDRFVGRDAELARLHGLLQTQTQVAIAGVSGLGGVGKSELALQYAREHLGDYPGGVVWLRAAAACGELVAFAQPRWFAQEDLTHLDTPEKQAAFCQTRWPKTADDPPGRVLLILDDVTDFAAQVQGFPVVGDRFRVLFTSRERWLNPESRLDLGVLKPAAALALLSNFVGEDRIAAEQATAETLCEWLGYLPLGLELVGKLLRSEPDWSIQSVLERMKGEKLQHEAMGEIEIAFNISWQQLSPTPQQLAVLLGCFGNGPIPWALVEATVNRCEVQPRRQRKRDRLWQWMTQKPTPQPEQWCLLLNRDRLAQSRRRLVELSLLERTGKEEYTLHPLIREFFAAQRSDWPEGGALQQAFLGQMVSVAKTVPPTMTLADLARTRSAWPHLATAAAASGEINDDDCGWPFTALARLAEGQGLWAEAEQHHSKRLSTTERRFGPDHPDTATSLNNLAALYKSQGRYEAAEPLLRRSLEIHERVLGADHPLTATSLNNLAELYQSQGRYEAAEPLRLRCLAIEEKVLPENHPQIAASLNNLALLYKSQRRYEEAEPLYRRSLKIWERVVGADHPDTALGLNNLANLYRSQGRYEAAEPLFRRSLEIWERVVGADHPDTALSLNNLAALYDSQGRYEAAEPLYRRSLEIRERVLGADHPSTATSLNNLAGLYKSQGQYEAAEPLFWRSLEIDEQVYGLDHPEVATDLNNLAELYRSQGRYEAAEPLYRRCVEIALTKLGQDHPNTQTFLGNFITFVQTVIEADRAAELSDYPLTQSILQQLTTPPNP